MADTKTSALSDADAIAGTEIVPVVQSGSNRKLSLSALLTWITSSLATALRLVPLVGANPNGFALRIVSGVPQWFGVSEVPDTSSATDGEVVRLVSGAPAWSATREVPTGGSNGQYLRTVGIDGDLEWSSAGLVPDSSTTGYVLTQRSGTAGDYGFEPPASGAPGAIQYNNGAGGLAGAANIAIGASGSLELTVDTAPTVPAAGKLTVFARALANKHLPAFVGPSGLDSALQPFMGRNKVGILSAAGAVSAVPVSMGLPGATAVGANGTKTLDDTSLLGSMRRSYNASAATAGSSCGYRTAVTAMRSANAWGGFLLIARFGEEIIVAGSRAFVGLWSSSGAMANSNPSVMTKTIGMSYDAGESSWSIQHNDGSGVCARIALGANFPANTSSEAYEIAIFSPPGGTSVWVRVERLGTAFVAEHELTTDLPANGQTLAFHIWANNGATAAAKGISLSTMYLESDY